MSRSLSGESYLLHESIRNLERRLSIVEKKLAKISENSTQIRLLNKKLSEKSKDAHHFPSESRRHHPYQAATGSTQLRHAGSKVSNSEMVQSFKSVAVEVLKEVVHGSTKNPSYDLNGNDVENPTNEDVEENPNERGDH
uniref:Uncharacterized protein n=1 Tax=Panagrolaimus sp. JU765 TaxID=591449 RepID=A0AC34QAF3_9BILA